MKMRILKLSCLLACSLSCLLSAAPRNNGGTVVVGAEKVTEAEDYETRHYTGQVVSKSVVNIVARVSGEILELGFRTATSCARDRCCTNLIPFNMKPR